MNIDDDLRRRFTALRNEIESGTPDFQSIRDRRRAAPGYEVRAASRSGWAPLLAVAGASALAALVWFVAAPTPVADEAPWRVGQWTMPSDVLLDLSQLPGEALMHDLPSFELTPIDGPDGAHNHPRHERTRV